MNTSNGALIVALVKCPGGDFERMRSYTLDGKCKDVSKKSSLFVITPEQDPTEFELAVLRCIEEYDPEVMSSKGMLEKAKEEAKILLDLARKELYTSSQEWSIEDEKIRNWLIEYFHQYKEDGFKTDKLLSWLEKQGEHKHQYKSRPRYVGEGDLLGANKQGEQILANSAKTCKDEQKDYAPKVEPKFKVGDVIRQTDKPEYTYTIREIKDGCYICDTCDFSTDNPLLELVKKKEWSEEDEKRIKNILSVLGVQVCWDGATGEKHNPYQKEINWLKSLRPQSHLEAE